MRNIVMMEIDHITASLLRVRHHAPFANMLAKRNIKLRDTYIHVDNLIRSLDMIRRVAHMKLRTKYQHLLVPFYDGRIFFIPKEPDEAAILQTVNVLTCLFYYIKDIFPAHSQPCKKLDLHVWGVYPLLSFVAGTNVPIDTLELIWQRAIIMRKELKFAQCSVEIKWRLEHLLDIICDLKLLC
jgi:hypothetical protein